MIRVVDLMMGIHYIPVFLNFLPVRGKQEPAENNRTANHRYTCQCHVTAACYCICISYCFKILQRPPRQFQV